jgi:hypothetical protein
MKKLIFTLMFTGLFSHAALAADFDETPAQQCYSTCMPEKAVKGRAHSVSDYLANRMACKSECADQIADNRKSSLVKDNLQANGGL